MPEKGVKQNNEIPTYLGHRARLRKRFLADDGQSMPDYEMLELLLMMSIPRRDVKPLAKRLIGRFKDMNGVINAPLSELMSFSGISENTATLIKSVAVCGLRSAGAKLKSREGKFFDGFSDFVHYCRQKLVDETTEKRYAFYFDSANKFLGENEISDADCAKTEIRKIMQDVIQKNATCVILAHNSLSEKAEPAKEDIVFTEELCHLLHIMNIEFYDHLVVANDKVFSFKSAGIMPSGEILEMVRRRKSLKKSKKQ